MPVKPIPDEYRSATPYIIIKGAVDAIEFYKKAFGAKENVRFPQPDGRIGHAEIQIGEARIMLADEFPEMDIRGPLSRGGSSVTILIYVEDVDARYSQALAAGATAVKPLQDQFYGDRAGTLRDPFGHVWALATHKEDVPHDELRKRMDAMKKPSA